MSYLAVKILFILLVVLRIESKLLLVDVDPGADDAMALAEVFFRASNTQVMAVTTVSGNAGVRNTTINLLKVLQVLGDYDTPVYSGSSQGMVFNTTTDHFFGEDGFGDFEFPYIENHILVSSEHACEAIVKTVRSFPGQITLLALGPLTNVALALHLHPPLLSQLKELVILGGSYQGKGNVKPGIEFNFYFDPEAVQFVLSKATPSDRVTLIPIETVEKAGYSMEWRKSVLGGIGSRSVKFLNKAESKSLEKTKEWHAYDPLAAAYVINPSVAVEWMKVKAKIETKGNLLRGALVIDYNSKEPNLNIITTVNQTKLTELLLGTLSGQDK